MKPTFLQVGEEGVFPKLVQNPAYGLNVRLFGVFGIDQDIIRVYNGKDVEIFSQYFIYVSLKDGRGIR